MASSKMIIVAAPSGSGKTSVVKYLLRAIPMLSFSVSATTRPPRKGEVHGEDYYFISVEAFKDKIEKKAFLEWEMVYKNRYYGTLHTERERIANEKKVPLLEIDVQGAIKIMTAMPKGFHAIFLKPPSIEELRERLIKRGTEDIHVIEDRIKKASYELTMATPDIFTDIFVNDNFEQCTALVEKSVRTYLEKP